MTKPEPQAPDFDGSQPCAETDPALWFPDLTMTEYHLAVLRKVCGECDFKAACLEYAIKNDMDGVWAGTLPVQRRKLAKQLGIKPVSVSTQTQHFFQSQTRAALNKRAQRERDREREAS